MRCPSDGAVLVMTERSGVEIDYCPECRGVWLDRGELDKIINSAGANARYSEPDPLPYYQDGHHDAKNHGHSEGMHGQKNKRRESFLGDIFDF